MSDKKQISDGYHTFAELYEHRHALFIALCRERVQWDASISLASDVWRSRLHADGTMYDDSFIMGLCTPVGRQINYHLPLRLWDATNFVPNTLDRAPAWDGHTSKDVVARLLRDDWDAPDEKAT